MNDLLTIVVNHHVRALHLYFQVFRTNVIYGPKKSRKLMYWHQYASKKKINSNFSDTNTR